jgi:hypothetical protein
MSCFYVTQKGASLHTTCVSVYRVCVYKTGRFLKVKPRKSVPEDPDLNVISEDCVA